MYPSLEYVFLSQPLTILLFYFILLFIGYPLHIYPKNLSCPLLLQAQQITHLSIKPRLIKVQQSLCISFFFMYNYFLKQIVDQLFDIFFFLYPKMKTVAPRDSSLKKKREKKEFWPLFQLSVSCLYTVFLASKNGKQKHLSHNKAKNEK